MLLPFRLADLRAELDVCVIISALRIAVCQYEAMAGNGGNERIGQKCEACSLRKVLPDEEIAIAGNPEYFRAGIADFA